MLNVLNFPIVLTVLAFAAFWLATRIGEALPRRADNAEAVHEDFNIIVGATLTLLGLIIGFTFSMASSRYDQRKNLEEEEANAIGTEYLRADLLPPAQAAVVKDLLRQYLDERLAYYRISSWQMKQLPAVNAETARLQDRLWSAVAPAAAAQPSPINSLVVSGMNDVLNSQGYTQAAWINRIPAAAWALMFVIGFFSNALIGFGAHGRNSPLLLVLPLLVAISFLLISDIDSPRGGFIRVEPRNLISLRDSFKGQ